MDWGALHYSSFFLFLVNIDYDAKPTDFFAQESWGGLPEKTSSTTLRSLNHVKGNLVHHLELLKGPSLLDHRLDLQRYPTSSPCPQHESSYYLLDQWGPGEKPLIPQLFRKGTAAMFTYFLWIQIEYNLSCMLSKHWGFLKILQVIQKSLILQYLVPLILLRKNMEKQLKKTHVIQINGLYNTLLVIPT